MRKVVRGTRSHTLILPGLTAEVSESALVIQRAQIGLG